jgi:hypothetical protein
MLRPVNKRHYCSSSSAVPDGRQPDPDAFLPAVPGWAAEAESSDYLGRADLLGLGLPPDVVRQLQRNSYLTGHGGEAVVEDSQLADLLGLQDRDEEGGPP